MVNSIKKGKAGEREWAKFCRERGFPDVRRGQQYNGLDGEDCINLPGVHQEVKRDEKLNIDKAMAQSIRDARKGTIPIVAHRKNSERAQAKKEEFYRGWKITMRAEDFLDMHARLSGCLQDGLRSVQER